jgi:hypothetical protein
VPNTSVIVARPIGVPLLGWRRRVACLKPAGATRAAAIDTTARLRRYLKKARRKDLAIRRTALRSLASSRSR